MFNETVPQFLLSKKRHSHVNKVTVEMKIHNIDSSFYSERDRRLHLKKALHRLLMEPMSLQMYGSGKAFESCWSPFLNWPTLSHCSSRNFP